MDEPLTRELSDGVCIVQGVEFDTRANRVAYHVLPSRPLDQFTNNAARVRIPAEEILHVLKPLAAGGWTGARRVVVGSGHSACF